VKNNLHKKPEFILCTPYGFIHEKALLWSTQVRSQAPAAALELLRDDGEPMPAMALLRELEQQFGPLHGSDHVATWALRGILDRAPEIFLGYGPLIARKISEGFRCLLTAAILSIVRSHGMASSAQIRSELVSRYHCFDNKHSYASCMNRLHDKLLRLPFYHYVHADNSDQEILAILSHSHHRFKHGRWVRSGDFYTNRAMLLLGLHYRRLGQDKVADEVRRQLLERNDVPADLLKRIREL
jgi:hypothetical protein